LLPDERKAITDAIEALSRDTESGWREVLRMAELYADFIRHHVKAADIEMHPYLPELESIIERAKQLPTPPEAKTP
jgi:hemerythrin-like domain-containing protein